MKNKKTKWLNLILHISAKINKLKSSIVQGGFFKTLFVALKIIILEIALLLISLPVYIFISPERFGGDSKEVQKYRLKRVVSLVTVCTFVVVFLVTTIFSGGIFLAGPVSELRADSTGWSFDSSGDYIYDSGKIQIIDGMALFNIETDKDLEVKGISSGTGDTYVPVAKRADIADPEEDTEENGEDEDNDSEENAEENEQEDEEELNQEPAEEQQEEEPAEEEIPDEQTGEVKEELTTEPLEEEQEEQETDEESGKIYTATLQPKNSLAVPNVSQWSGFVEASAKNGGEIYYQLSDNNGGTWYYWGGSKWEKAGSGNYNTASTVNDKIGKFPVESAKIMFKAFFVGSSENKIQLLDISVKFSQEEVKQEEVEEQLVEEVAEEIKADAEVMDEEENITTESFGKGFKEISSGLIKLMEDYYSQYGKFPRSWGGYNFTDIGLDASDWEAAIGHIIYAPTGDRLQIRPEEGYGFEAVKANGETVKMSYKLKYNFVYYIADKTWYYHKKDPVNIIDISTFKIYSTETGEIIPDEVEDKDDESKDPEDKTVEEGVTEKPQQMDFEAGGIDSKTGENKSDSGNLIRTPGFIEVKPGATYTVSGYSDKAEWPRIYFYDKDKKFISVEGSDTATVPENAAYARVRLTLKEAGQLPETIVFEGEGIEDEEVNEEDQDAEGKEEEDTDDDFIALSVEVLKEAGAVSPDFNSWKDIPETGALQTWGGESRFYVENPDQEYNVKVKANLSEGKYGGYGIFFDTTSNSEDASDDTGHILQFDRGYGEGAIVIRPRVGGYEFSPVKVLKASDDGVIPTKTSNPQWWTAEHIVTIDVSVTGSDSGSINKKIGVYVDGIFIFDYEYKTAVPEEGQKFYTGLRAWATKVNFYGASLKSDSPPQYKSAEISGSPEVGKVLAATGTGYNDANGDPEGKPLFQWLISDSADGTYKDIPGQAGDSYKPVAGDAGKFIKVAVTPTALTGISPGTAVTSPETAAVKIADEAPLFTAATVAGLAKVGSVLTGSGVGYYDVNGDQAATPLYQWTICDSANGTYSDIPGSTNSTYKPVFADLGKFIKVKITPTALTGTSPGVTLTSEATSAVVETSPTAPLYTGAAITGTAKVGIVLTASGVGYYDANGDLEATPAYQWLICSSADGTYSSIPGATNSTYTPLFEDLGKYIKVKVTPKALTGTSQGTPVISAETAAVQAAPESAPSFTAATVTGTAKVGTALTASGVGYSDINGDQAATPLYQWTICDSADGTYSDIPGATNSTYKPVFADLGKFIKVKVTPTALTGTSPGATLTSAATAAVAAATTAAAPSYTGATITGIAKVGSMLTASGVGYSDINGDLEATPAYQWLICSSADGTYSNIQGATNSTYTPVSGDLGKFIKVKVTPKALTGTSQGTPVISAETEAVLAAEAAPSYASAVITGTAQVGQALTAEGIGYNDVNGDLEGTTLYQWIICSTSGGTYVDIPGAVSGTYKPVFADLGKFIKVKVTPAAMTGKSPGSTVRSAETAAVSAAEETGPSFKNAVITGTAKVGEKLTASASGYSDLNGDLAATPLYQWTISDTAGGTYSDIPGATNNTYKPVFADLGKFIKVKVTPTAQTGTPEGTPVISSASAAVSAAAETGPSFTSAVITGTAKVGSVLTASGVGYYDMNGDLAGTTMYQWTICSSEGGTYVDIPGAIKSTYTPVIGNLDKFIKVKVVPAALTGKSPGSAVISAATAAVGAADSAPTFTGAAVTGTAKVGEKLTASGVGYSDLNGDLAATPLYQWTISDTVDGTYSDIADATNSSYTPLSEDLGKFIKVIITPRAQTGISPGLPVTSAATEAIKIAEAPPSFSGVVMTGLAKVGADLRAAGLGYSDVNGDPIKTPLYQWTISDTVDGTYTNIPGATGYIYSPVIDDLGKFIKVILTPRAQTGATPGTPIISAATAAIKPSTEEAAPTYSGAVITGTAKVGEVLTAKGVGYSDVNGDKEATPLFQWMICNTLNGKYNDIEGATESTYTPGDKDLDKFIKVSITPTAKTGATPGVPVISDATEVVLAAEKAPEYTGAIITGAAIVGNTLTASGTGYSDTNGDEEATALYQWKISDLPEGDYTNIPGATDNTYTTLPEDEGKYIIVEVIPAALTGESPGTPVLSDSTDAVKPAPVKPVIVINSAAQQGASSEVIINYDLFGANEELKISLEVFDDSENASGVSQQSLAGDIGQGIMPGKGKTITWDVSQYFEEIEIANLQIRLIAEGIDQNLSDYAYASLALDTSAPAGLGNFSGVNSAVSSILWSWIPVNAETNFKYYRILYSSNIADVQNETDDAMVWDANDDATLADMETAFTVIGGLSEATTYYAKIYAYDNYGNKSTSEVAQFDTGVSNSVTPGDPIINDPQNNGNSPGISISGIAQSGSSIDLYVDGEIMFEGFAEAKEDGRFEGTVVLEEGQHQICAVAVDNNGNPGSKSNTIGVNIEEENQPAENSGITSKTGTGAVSEDVFQARESAILQRPQIIEVKGTDRDNIIRITGKGIPNSEVVIFIHSEQVLVYRVNVDQNGDWALNHSQDFVELSEGDHEVYAITLDANSQVKSSISETRKFQVEINRLAIILSYFDLPTTLLTIFVLLAGIAVFYIWRLRDNRAKRRKNQA